MNIKLTGNKHLAAAALSLLFILIIAVNIFPVFRNFSHLGTMDWDQFYFFTLLPYISYVRDTEIPFWTPYEAGGREIWSHPHSPAFSPFFPLFIIFGIIKGYKILLPIHLFIGLWGMYILGGRLGMKKAGRIGAGLLFVFSSYIPIHYAAGNDVDTTPGVFFPFALYFFLRFTDEKKLKFGALSALSMLVMFFEGGFYGFIHFFWLFACFALLKAFLEKKFSIIKYAAAVFLIILALGEFKILPSVRFVMDNPRKEAYNGLQNPLGMSVPAILYTTLLEKKQVPYPSDEIFTWTAHSGYIGLLPLACVIFLFFYRPKRYPVEKALALFFLLLNLEGNFFLSRYIWYFLRHFPVFNSMRHSSDTLFSSLFCISLLFGYALSDLTVLTEKKRLRRLLPAAVILISALDLAGLNNSVYDMTFVVPEKKASASPAFRQAAPPNFTKKGVLIIGNMYYDSLHNNYGLINAYTNVWGIRKAVPFNSSEYRGEIYFLNQTGKIKAWRMTSNKVTAEVSLPFYDKLVLNQNFSRHWKIRGAGPGARVIAYRGLAAADLNAGEYTVTFYYFPVYTLILLFFTAGAAAFIILKRDMRVEL